MHVAKGCDLAPGYHMCRPLSPDRFTAWLGQQPMPILPPLPAARAAGTPQEPAASGRSSAGQVSGTAWPAGS